jgi:hypothetical protein
MFEQKTIFKKRLIVTRFPNKLDKDKQLTIWMANYYYF